jgi:hypothetical protein
VTPTCWLKVAGGSLPSDLTDRVLWFVADETGANWTMLTLETRLRDDIGLEGDEATFFFLEFGKQFGVDLSELDLTSYFHSDAELSFPLGFIWVIQDLYLWYRGKKLTAKKDIQVSDLLAAARARKWIELS